MSTEWLTEAFNIMIVLIRVMPCIAIVPLAQLVIAIAHDLVFGIWEGKERIHIFITMVIAMFVIILLFYIFTVFLQIEIST